MRKKVAALIVLILFMFTSNAFSSDIRSAEEESEKYHGTQEEMLTIPDLITPDSIYTTLELKAIYYQNIQIISLLKDMRALLKQSVDYQQQQLEKEEY